MNETTKNSNELINLWQNLKKSIGLDDPGNSYLELIEDPPENRPSRMCISISDIHLTDGTVGFQNLKEETWEAFYATILQRCIKYKIKELLLVFDGDIIDMIRSKQWAKNGIYPWERHRQEEFSKVVNDIIVEIVDTQHRDFFDWLTQLPGKLEKDTNERNPGEKNINAGNVKIIITLGNHDKELFCDQKALTYFYEKGLGRNLEDISPKERLAIGRMYGDEKMFADAGTAPYLPFYYGDRGFRFFTTHGQWRDSENSRVVDKTNDLPGWSVKDGWNTEIWQKLRYSPFFLPCFGDTVAAGVLSTFIYKVKEQLADNEIDDPDLNSIIDELDLYRPTYAAVSRILHKTAEMRSDGKGKEAIQIIEETIYTCIIDWLSWDFTYQTSPLQRRIGLKTAKKTLELMNSLGHGMQIKTIAGLMKILAFFHRHHTKGLSLKDMQKFPSFMKIYQHYGFQIHGEGHTHLPLQEESKIEGEQHPSTYINFGTWRDQIVPRINGGYRRRGVLRALFILDLFKEGTKEADRSFNFFVEDIILWRDEKDPMADTSPLGI